MVTQEIEYSLEALYVAPIACLLWKLTYIYVVPSGKILYFLLKAMLTVLLPPSSILVFTT